MDEDPLHSERPPDEVWWERELHRNEKLMDKYMAVLGDNPDWDKWQNPEEVFDRIEREMDAAELKQAEEEAPEASAAEADDKWLDEAEAGFDESDEDWEDPDSNPEVNANYEPVATRARRFALAVFDLEKMPGNAELLFLSAGKIGANLAGGHGLGYDEESICGNIVKCRWALSDCEFCREMLEQLRDKTGDSRYGNLAIEASAISELIRERIARLRKRVWW